LQDILVNKDFEDIFKQVKEQLPNIKMKHGGMEPPQKPKAKVHPMVKLMNYIEKNNIKLIDFFSQLDKRKTYSNNTMLKSLLQKFYVLYPHLK
jgi:hypothetical protein